MQLHNPNGLFSRSCYIRTTPVNTVIKIQGHFLTEWLHTSLMESQLSWGPVFVL